MAVAQVLGQRARAPVRGVDRLFVQRGVHDARLDLRRDSGRAATARGVVAQCIHAVGQETPARHCNLAPVQASLDDAVRVLPPIGSEQNDQRSLLQPSLHRAALGKPAKLSHGMRPANSSCVSF
jgi:hypothetical protein